MNQLKANQQQSIIALRAQGWFKRRIARERGVDRSPSPGSALVEAEGSRAGKAKLSLLPARAALEGESPNFSLLFLEFSLSFRFIERTGGVIPY